MWRAWLLVMAACGPGLATPDARTIAADSLASASGDAAKIRALLASDVALGGLWFEAASCVEFSAPVIVPEAKLDAVAACLAKLRWRPSARKDALGDVTVLEIAPGFELEARVIVQGGQRRLSWIGYATRDAAATAPTITPAALEALRTAGDRNITVPPGVARPAGSWLRVCLDETGAMTATTILTSNLAAQDAFANGIAAWKFRPFEIGGQPVPVCASVRVTDPVDTGTETLPLPPPPSRGKYAHVMFDRASVVEGKRISGRTLITPDIDTQKDMANRRLSHLHASLRVCLDETGHVESVLPVQSSGYANYDARLIGTIRTWVYSPLQVDGEARPFCTMVSFHFKGRLR